MTSMAPAGGSNRPHCQQSAPERDRIAEAVATRLDKPLTVAGIIFALVVLTDTTTAISGRLQLVFEVVGWLLWALFVSEFVARMLIAPSTQTFLRRNWWQLIFLAVPFLRFLRPLTRMGLPRLGRVVSSAVRTSRTATRELSGRVTWLAALTLIVVLSAGQIAHAYGDYDSYGTALHDAAMSAITGEPLGQDAAVVQVLEIALAMYSVVVFAALAGSLGAFFLERRDGDDA